MLNVAFREIMRAAMSKLEIFLRSNNTILGKWRMIPSCASEEIGAMGKEYWETNCCCVVCRFVLAGMEVVQVEQSEL